MVSGPHCGGEGYPSITSSVERNDLCAYVNDALNLECLAHNFSFFTLFDIVVDQKALKIPGLFYDHHHLCLPPSKIGNALNALLYQRIDGAFSCFRSPFRAFSMPGEVHAVCTLVVSDIPNWHTGMAFDPGKEVSCKEELFEVGNYMLLIELPFLIYPKDVTLEFNPPAINIRTSVHGVLESWDVSKVIQAGNVIHAYSEHSDGISKMLQ